MYDSGLEACRLDLYTDEASLRDKYPVQIADKVMRVREMHQWMLANPAAKDAMFVSEAVSRFGISRPTAYSDLKVIKVLLPFIEESSKDFHRWRFNEMILKTFEMAEKRKDARTMERASATYAKFNNVDKEEAADIPIDQIIPQPFIATDDPSVLGIKPVANIRERQRKLIEKYMKDVPDIVDVEFEDADLEEDRLFPDEFNKANAEAEAVIDEA